MMVILKIPIAYLCFVVYWAVKAEPKPPEPVALRLASRRARPEGPVVAEQPPARAPGAGRARPGTRSSRDGDAVSANPVSQSRPAESVAGLLASLSIFVSLIGVAYRPARLIPRGAAAGAPRGRDGRPARRGWRALALGDRRRSASWSAWRSRSSPSNPIF